jgi:hypothetical protein
LSHDRHRDRPADRHRDRRADARHREGRSQARSRDVQHQEPFPHGGADPDHLRRHNGLPLSDKDALAWITDKAATNPDGYDISHGYRRTFAWELANVTAAQAEVDRERAEFDRLNAAYTGWSRFFVVTSSTGHIHSNMRCSTCRWTTTFGWLPNLSGLTEADAVAECGPALCSVCFPSAPLDHFGKLTAAQARKLAA